VRALQVRRPIWLAPPNGAPGSAAQTKEVEKMSKVRLVGVALAAACAAVAVALVAVPTALAGVCGTSNTNFQLGILNTCDTGPSTELDGTGPNGLFVKLTGTSANTRPIIGYAFGSAGAGSIGVSGSTNSVDTYSAGVAGALNDSAPAADGAGVRGV